MINVDFFKQQAKNFLKDYKTRVFNEDEGYYEYSPRFFNDFDDIAMCFDIDEQENFGLMNAQHVIAKLSGFNKWTDLIKASEPILEVGKLLLTNREKYQENVGLFTNMVESLIVDDWKTFERENLKDADDKTKLEVFKQVFLNDGQGNKKKYNSTIKIDFANDANGQDMLMKIMKEKNLPSDKALLSTITQKNCLRIIETGWGSIALPLWGHADPYDEKEQLPSSVVEIKLNKTKGHLVHLIMEKEDVNFYTAISYFMLFQLEALGYHI